MPKFIRSLFSVPEHKASARPNGKFKLIGKVEIPHSKGFTVVRKDIMERALKARINEAA